MLYSGIVVLSCIGGVVAGREAEMNEVYGFLRSAGTTMSAFNAWVFLKGLETLVCKSRMRPIQMRTHGQEESGLPV